MTIDPKLETLFQEELDRLQPGIWSKARITPIDGIGADMYRTVYFSAYNARREKKLGIGVDLKPDLTAVMVKTTAAKFRLVDIGKLNAYNLASKTFEEDAMESAGAKPEDLASSQPLGSSPFAQG